MHKVYWKVLIYCHHTVPILKHFPMFSSYVRVSETRAMNQLDSVGLFGCFICLVFFCFCFGFICFSLGFFSFVQGCNFFFHLAWLSWLGLEKPFFKMQSHGVEFTLVKCRCLAHRLVCLSNSPKAPLISLLEKCAFRVLFVSSPLSMHLKQLRKIAHLEWYFFHADMGDEIR